MCYFLVVFGGHYTYYTDGIFSDCALLHDSFVFQCMYVIPTLASMTADVFRGEQDFPGLINAFAPSFSKERIARVSYFIDFVLAMCKVNRL